MSHRLQVLVPEELEGRLRKAAGRARLSKGEWVRTAIEEKLGRELASSADPLAALSSLEAPTADIEVMLAEIEAGRR
jgi:predicted transcriptional regulator